MKRSISILTLAWTLLCLTAPNGWARLPRPTQISGVVLALDHETQTLVFKAAKEKKPFVLDWNKETEFIKDGRPATPMAITNGAALVIHFKEVSFRNPLLKKVSWNERVSGP